MRAVCIRRLMGNLLLCIVSRSEADYYLVSVLFFTQPINKNRTCSPLVHWRKGGRPFHVHNRFLKGTLLRVFHFLSYLNAIDGQFDISTTSVVERCRSCCWSDGYVVRVLQDVVHVVAVATLRLRFFWSFCLILSLASTCCLLTLVVQHLLEFSQKSTFLYQFPFKGQHRGFWSTAQKEG